jgi:hypothetical protein
MSTRWIKGAGTALVVAWFDYGFYSAMTDRGVYRWLASLAKASTYEIEKSVKDGELASARRRDASASFLFGAIASVAGLLASGCGRCVLDADPAQPSSVDSP